MRVGNIDGLLGAEIWQTIYDSGELSSAQTSITISNLDGDNDKEYRLIVRTTNINALGVLPNNDTGSSYGQQLLWGNISTAYAARYTDPTGLVGGIGSGFALYDIFIFAKSGYIRTSIDKHAATISGTTVGLISINGCVWNNTTDNITSLVLTSNGTQFGIGSRIILMKKSNSTSKMKTGNLNVQGKVKGTFQKIYKTTLTSAATSVTISGLDGNTDQLYRLIIRTVNGYNGAVNYLLRLNNDTGSNYGRQTINGSGSSVTAARLVYSGALTGYIESLNSLSLVNTIIHAKSGYIRTILTELNTEISGTTIGYLYLIGLSWNNTADNITSLVIFADQTNGLGVGTVIELERYTP